VKTTSVVMSEVFKVIASVVLLGIERQESIPKLFGYLKHELVDRYQDFALLAVPAGLYTLQNNLLFVALQNLDGTTYQVTYQLKIFMAAVFSVLLLGKKLSSLKWIALFILMAGVSLVQFQPEKVGSNSEGSTTVGLLAVLAACCTSGFAGVYFEKILKDPKFKCSVWMRNVQLGLFSTILGLAGVVRPTSSF
jgi:solute carrier family 35 (UDP-sugar transporter), member A1/2/3